MNLDAMVFVFGSNRAGAHGAGAALEAARRGFPHGLGTGYWPGPRLMWAGCYAIPTKDERIQTLELSVIRKYVVQFKNFVFLAGDRLRFQVTRVGCGLAGYADEDIAPLFDGAPLSNVWYDTAWREFFRAPDAHQYWGTFP